MAVELIPVDPSGLGYVRIMDVHLVNATREELPDGYSFSAKVIEQDVGRVAAFNYFKLGYGTNSVTYGTDASDTAITKEGTGSVGLYIRNSDLN